MPLISIVIPVYNTEIFLPKCLDSAVGQSFSDIEIIVVDDGSPGNCKEICSRYPQIKYLSYGENRGIFYAREYGVLQASGQYIFNIDSDDWLPLDACSHIAKAVSKKDCDIYMHRTKRLLANNTLNRPAFKVEGNLMEYFTKKKPYVHVFLWQLTLKREILLKAYEDLQVTERFLLSDDVLIFHAYLFYAQSWEAVHEVCYCYNETSVSTTRKKMTTESALRDLKFMDILFTHLEAFRKAKGLPEDTFEGIKKKQFADRLMESKPAWQDLDWNQLLPQYIEIFGGSLLASCFFDISQISTIKVPIRKITALMIRASDRLLPEGSWIFNILQKLWWKFKK